MDGHLQIKYKVHLNVIYFRLKLFIYFVTNSNCLIPISLQSDYVNLWYCKLRLFGLTEFIVWNIKGLRLWVAKI